MKRGQRSHDAREIFSPHVFKSWLLTYTVKIGEIGEILLQSNTLFLQSICIYGSIAVSIYETSLQAVIC